MILWVKSKHKDFEYPDWLKFHNDCIRICFNFMFAKFLVPISSALAINECTVKDTFVFAKETNKTDCEYFKASSDVEILFINISLE